MLTVLLVLAWTLAVLVGLVLLVLVLVLALPFEAEAAGALDGEDVDGVAQARIGWGLVSLRAATEGGVTFRIMGFGAGRRVRPGRDDEHKKRAKAEKKRAKAEKKRAKAEKKRAKKEKKAQKPQKPPKRRRTRGDFWRARGAFTRTAGRFVRALHLQGHVAGTVGLDDPADTAAVVGVVNALAASQSLLDVSVQPDWVSEDIRLHGRVSTRFRLGAFAWVALRALFDPAIRRALRGRRVNGSPPKGGARGVRRWST